MRRDSPAARMIAAAFTSASRACAREDARPEKIDFESERQLPSGSRRMAIISAAYRNRDLLRRDGADLETHRRVNAFERFGCGMPSFSSSLITAMTLRLLPIMEMYRAGVVTAQRSTRMSSRWPARHDHDVRSIR